VGNLIKTKTKEETVRAVGNQKKSQKTYDFRVSRENSSYCVIESKKKDKGGTSCKTAYTRIRKKSGNARMPSSQHAKLKCVRFSGAIRAVVTASKRGEQRIIK